MEISHALKTFNFVTRYIIPLMNLLFSSVILKSLLSKDVLMYLAWACIHRFKIFYLCTKGDPEVPHMAIFGVGL